jgi:hypothetical protein
LLEQILARACNVWDKAPVECFTLHDVVIHGAPLQKYETLPRMRAREELSVEENMQLDTYITKKDLDKKEE